MNIKFDYCKCIRIYEKAHLRSDFWQSIDYKYILQKYYFGGGQKFMHVSYNEWSLETLVGCNGENRTAEISLSGLLLLT